MKIHNIDKVTDERWLNLYGAEYEHEGKSGRWLFASRRDRSGDVRSLTDGPAPIDAVVIVPIRVDTESRQLVLIREFRIPVGGYIYGLPAGLIDPGEGVDETIRRELKEETGLDLVRVLRTSQGVYSSSGMTDEAVAMAFVEVGGDPSSRPQLESSEDLEPVFLDFDQVLGLYNDREAHVDVKTWMVLHLFATLGELR